MKPPIDPVRQRINEVIKQLRRVDAVALLAKYGALNTPALKQEDYAGVLREAQQLLSGEAP
jgi:hypothetical protein